MSREELGGILGLTCGLLLGCHPVTHNLLTALFLLAPVWGWR